MKRHTTSLRPVLGALLLLVYGCASTTPALKPGLQLPEVSAPIPVTDTSRPFLGAESVVEAAGYVEHEFFLSGQAHVYEWGASGHDVEVVAGPGRYVTRILVWRPRDAAKFGGNVEVTVLNASLGVDFGGPSDFRRMVEQGDVWIGITTKALTAAALKRFDPDRYASLDWSNPAAPEARCAQPSIIPVYMVGEEAFQAMMEMGAPGSAPETEDGLVWDMLGQLGLLLKSEQREKILPGFARPSVYMTGVSQSSIYMRTWIAGFHRRYRTPDGGPVYDGYLGIVGPALVRIHQCSPDVPLEDPRQKLLPPDVPFISLSSEGEMWMGRYTHQPDVLTPTGGIVTYEVAGASHNAREVPGVIPEPIGMAPPEDLAKAGLAPPDMSRSMPSDLTLNDFVWAPVVRGAYRNLQLWAGEGVEPPRAPGIQLDANLEIERDAYGNALGGVRTPYIEVPIASFRGYLTAGGMGGVIGSRTPFPPETLKSLYPDRASYRAAFASATERIVAERWISPEDGAAMKMAAEQASLSE